MKTALATLVLLLSALPGRAHVAQSIRDYDGTDASVLPTVVSATGLYDNAKSKNRAVTAGIKAYEVNTPLWSDGASKQRFIDVPAGAKVTPTDSDQYAIPEKTVFIKNFSIDTVYGDSLTRILIETRFLVVAAPTSGTAKRYLGFTYKWRRNQQDADLLDPGAGLDTAILIRLNGKIVGKRWSYPSGTDCNQCHRGRGTLGFITPQLNRPDPANPSVNQIKALYAAGILSADIYKSTLHRWVGLKDTGTGATPEAKARSYLAANCSHCHGNKVSLEGADHDFDYFSPAKGTLFPQSKTGYVGKPSGKEPGFPKIIYAGFPESSYVLFRMQSRGDLSYHGLAQMPPLATYQMDSGAVKVMRDWICSLGTKTRACAQPQVQDDASYWEPVTGLGPRMHGSQARISLEPRIRNGILTLPFQGKSPGSLALYTTDGKAIPLAPIDREHWKLPATVRSGIHFLIINGRPSPIAVLP